MINSSLETPLSPRTNAVKQRSRKVIYGTIAFLFTVGISLGLYFIFSNGFGDVVETKETQEQIRSGEAILKLGDYEVCNWEFVEFDSHIPFTLDGKDNGYFDFDVEEDLLVQGFLCDTDQEVLLAVDNQGLHGSILDSDNVVKVTAIDEASSTLTISDQELPKFTESELTEVVDKKWKEYIASRKGDRRAMNVLEPGSVDIHIHLDIDSHMVQTHGSAFAAARYGVELIAVVNRDAYINLGFNLKVVSINVRSSFLSQTQTTDAYLTELQKIPRPVNVNLLHSLSTRGLGGGIAYLGGLYTDFFCYGVSAIYGDFHLWDRYVVAHELGHNFGADHTHEMVPQVDTCGTSCPANPTGTIMSYCHLCNGGLNNIIGMQWHERVREVILEAYALENDKLASRSSCQNFPQYPDVGVPFSLKGDACLAIDTSSCTECSTETCSIDSVYQFTGTQIKASQDLSFCWTASADCSSISLQTCGDSSNQQFSFEENSLKSESCGAVKYAGESALFTGSVVSTWCSPDENPNAGQSCEHTTIPLTCGETHTGSTENDCDGQRRFTFVAPDQLVTVSTCGTEFDSTLSVENADSRIHYSDDDGNCGRQAELLNMNLDQGAEYTIVLGGYGFVTGNYNIALTCSDVDPDQTPEPTVPQTSQPPIDCDSTVIELECGNPVLGSTVNSCDAEQRFVFTATTSVKTISTCGSDYDTILDVYDSNNERVAFNDDSEECGLRSLIKDLAHDIGSEYTVFLQGYSDQVGNYKVELVCQSDDASLLPTMSPTSSLDPTVAPSQTDEPTMEPTMTTLDPTMEPTMATLDPTMDPTQTDEPTMEPTVTTLDPTTDPTQTDEPTMEPTMATSDPTMEPTMATLDPTMDPTPSLDVPTFEPTMDPTQMAEQTLDPTMDPTGGCVSTIIPLTCGDMLTGTTVGTCDNEQRFVFTATTSVKTISACESGYDTMLTVYDSNNEQIAHQDDSNECGLQSLLEDVPLNIDSEYTVVLSGFNSRVGDYSLELICDGPQETQAPTAEPATGCDAPIIDIACGETLTGNTVESCDGEQLFRFTATTSMKTISTCDSQYDTMLSIYSADGELVFHQDDSRDCGVQSFIQDLELSIGSEYTIVLHGFSNQVGAYSLELTCGSTCDDSIQTLNCGDVVTESTANACQKEKTFQFTATSGLTTISSCGSEFDTVLEVSNNGDFNRYVDDTQICGRHSVVSDLELEAGEDYFVTLSGYNGASGNFRLEVTCDTLTPTLEPTAPFQEAYTTIPGGKCQTLDGGDPTHEYHGGVSNCERLCTERSYCFGYSRSRYSNCLLWTQSDLMGGGGHWGGASCHIKNIN